MKLRRGDVVWTDYYDDAVDMYGQRHNEEHYEKWVIVYTKQKYFHWSKKKKKMIINDSLVMCLTTRKLVRIHSRYLRTDIEPNKIFVHKEIV